MVEVFTYKETKEQLGLRHHQTVQDLVEQLGLTPKPVPHSGRGKGLTRSDIASIRERLRPMKAERPDRGDTASITKRLKPIGAVK